MPELGLAPAESGGPHAELVRDERTLRASHLVSEEVWDEHRDWTAGEFAAELESVRAELESGTGFQVIVYVDGQPAATGGCGIVAGVARLWGAGTLEAFRGRGAYRQLLMTRISTALEHGATLALVKGRVETSGPILLRAGFVTYGEERCYCLPILS
jgi:GNAT superfamily N-acetyltransferase